MIDPATVQKIKDTADIVEVVSDYVHLVRRGSNFMGLCPFHNERTPSFSVNRRKNFCYCFSCKKGGGPVNFIMEKEGLSYHEALLHLAKKYGIEVQERELTDEERRRQSEREAMLVANEWAMHKMEDDLLNTDEGRDVGLSYLTERGVTDEAIRAFHLGYAIDNGQHLCSAARSAGFDPEVFKKLGLVGTSQQGRDYDRFRGRVIFPILNTSGKVIAFGGRDLKGGLAKYINSPESDLYKKSNELYGIFQARSAIVRENKCYLVEGYMDVIGMWQSGMKNVVASSGTALTDGQIAMIHRFTDNITLIYDGDSAGIKASLRGIDMLLRHKLNVKVMLLPDGDDPDSFAKKHTPQEFQDYVAEHETDFIRFKVKVMLADVKNDPRKRIEAVNSVAESVANISDPVARDVYVQECAHLLDISEEAVAKAVNRARYALTEKWKRERQWQGVSELSDKSDRSDRSDKSDRSDRSDMSDRPDRSDMSDRSGLSGISDNAGRGNIQPQAQPAINPFQKIEKQVMQYCVRYGFYKCIMLFDESGAETGEMIDPVEFVDQELRADDMQFSVPIYHQIMEEICSMRAAYEEREAIYRRQVEEDAQKKRKEGFDRIASQDLSVYQIEKEERKLEDEVNQYRADCMERFSKDYVGRELANHPDDNVRRESIELLREKFHLSAIYSREASAERIEDKLSNLVPRSILEWKSELLNMRVRDLLIKLNALTGKDLEEEGRIQEELADLFMLRSQVAKDLGERILLPKLRLQ